MKQNKREFGLFTTISMICGVVIGSGIFFKTDDILYATQGNVLMGILLWIIGAFGIIFGGLCVSQYSKKSSVAGGLITYCEMAWGRTFAYLAGWFQTIFYFPAIISVLSWIAAIYIGLIFGITDSGSSEIWLIMMLIIASSFILNILSTSTAAWVQNIATTIKIAALLGLSIVGLIYGDFGNLGAEVSVHSRSLGTGIFTGLVACAFSFDGWFVGPTIAHEIENPKKNLTKALVLSPLIILSVYLVYFISINVMLGPDLIMQLQDGSVGYIVNGILGPVGVKLVYLAVSISVLGSINGLVLGYIRLPYSLAIRNEFPKSEVYRVLNPKTKVPVASALFSLIMVIIWSFLHFLSVKGVKIGIVHFSGLQIDSLPIVLTYVFYGSLYLRLFIDFFKTRSRSFYYGFLYPLLAMLGACLVLFGGMSQANSGMYFLISFMGIGAGLLIRPKQKKTDSHKKT